MIFICLYELCYDVVMNLFERVALEMSSVSVFRCLLLQLWESV